MLFYIYYWWHVFIEGYWQATNGTISSSSFTNNSTNFGGAIFWTGSKGILTKSSLIENTGFLKGDEICLSMKKDLRSL